MNKIFKFVFAFLFALLIAFVFNIFFLNLLERPFTDQIFLVAFSSAALGYLISSFLDTKLQPKDFLAVIKDQFNKVSPHFVFRKYAAGIILSALFFAVYLIVGLQLNDPNFDSTDNYLDADNSTWMARISEPNGSSMEMRGPHPFAYFIFRPLGWLLNLVTKKPALSAILLNTFTGALCVYMTWVFIEHQFHSSTYALLIASLLGLSTAHFFFGSVIETYIFSAAALIGFVLMIQKHAESRFAPVMMSLLTFGITLTNFAQNFIFFLVDQLLKFFNHQEDEKKNSFRVLFINIFQFSALTLSFGILISLVHAAWYPSSKLFFLLSNAQAEEEFAFSIFQEPTWRAVGRVLLIIRTMFLYTVIAPMPYVFGNEVGGTFPRFNFFKIAPETFSYSSYHGLGNILILLWAGLVFTSGFFFLKNIFRSRKADLSLAFVLCLLFNFILHLNYGYEPFLYSPDWAYALIFFVAFSLAPLANKRWFQYGMFVFLGLLAFNQLQFFNFIFQTISPYIK